MSGRAPRIAVALACALLCFVVAVGALIGADHVRSEEGLDAVLYLPNENLLTHFTAGLNTVVADLLWLHCIQYTALEHRGPRNYTWLEHMLYTATRLDPYFVDVYRYGAMFLGALREEPESSLRLAQQGMLMNPRSWALPYEAAMVYLMYKSDHPDARYFATHYLSLSSAAGGAPGGVVHLAAKLQSEYDLVELERDMWVDMLNSGDSFLRELAERKLFEIETRKMLEVINERLALFRERTGRNALNLEELVEHGLLRSVPEELLGGEFIVASDGRAYSTSLLEDVIIRKRNPIENAIDEYFTTNGWWPGSLERLVETGLLDEIPEHPHPDRQWRYDPDSGTIE